MAVCNATTLLYHNDMIAYSTAPRTTWENIRRIMGRSWQENMSNADSMYCASLPVCTRCSDNADCDGLVMTTVWRVVPQTRQSGAQKECSNSSRPETTHGCDFCDKICPSHTRLPHWSLQPKPPAASSSKHWATSGWITHGHVDRQCL